MKQGSCDATDDIHRPDVIAETSDALYDRRFQLLRRHCVSDAAVRPEDSSIEAAAITVGPFVPEGRRTHVDDVRVGSSDVLDIYMKLLPNGRQRVGQKNI